MTSQTGESGLLFGGGWARRRWTLSRDRRTFAVRWWFDVATKDGAIAVPMRPVPTAHDSDCKGTHDATPTLVGAELSGEQAKTVDEDNWRERVWTQR